MDLSIAEAAVAIAGIVAFTVIFIAVSSVRRELRRERSDTVIKQEQRIGTLERTVHSLDYRLKEITEEKRA
jgi:hypothetical protein